MFLSEICSTFSSYHCFVVIVNFVAFCLLCVPSEFQARQDAEHAREGLKAARSEIQAAHAELRENALGRISKETGSAGSRLPYSASLEEEKWQPRYSGASSADGSSSTCEAKEESKT